MARILVVGGFPDEVAPVQTAGASGSTTPLEFVYSRAESRRYLAVFASYLSEEIIERDHILLGGCQSDLDKAVAEVAQRKAIEKGKDPDECVISYVGENTHRAHNFGRILQSELREWNLIGSRLMFPEPLVQADAVVVLGGFEGTLRAVNLARLLDKPILPVASFGLAAAEIYRVELESFEARYASRVRRSDYERLNVVLSDTSDASLKKLATQVVALAERMISPTDVFVIMSFSEDPGLEDAYETFVSTCDKEGFKAFRVDHHLDESKRIVEGIMESIHRSAFVIADVSEHKQNVYYELGYAKALGKPVIVTAREGTELPFDIFDVPTLFWKNQRALRDGLQERIGKIRVRLGGSPHLRQGAHRVP
jgi:hypothetical protein